MSAKLLFDATQVQPWRGVESEAAHEHALRLWLSAKNADEEIRDFDFACKMALHDRDFWEALQQWAWSQPELPEWALAPLGRVLGRKPPRRGVGATKRRDALLRAIAAQIQTKYKLPLTRGTDTGTGCSISAILSGLPGLEMIQEKTIINILTRSQI